MQRSPPICETGSPGLRYRWLVTAHVVNSHQLIRSGDQLLPVTMTEGVAFLVGLGTGRVARPDELSARSKEVGIGRRDLVRYLAVEERQETDETVRAADTPAWP